MACRKLVISDIHGNGDALLQLLEEASFSPSRDQLYLLGDYVKKGPDSLGNISIIRCLREDAGAIVLRGNHEDKWLSGNYQQDYPLLTKEWECFLNSLPYWHEDQENIYVHAGIRHGIPLQKQDIEDLTTIREDFFRQPNLLDQKIIFGHTCTLILGADEGRVWIQEDKIGIDTGAAHQKYLTLVDLSYGVEYSKRIGMKNDSIYINKFCI